VGCSSAVEQATSWPADPRDRGEPAQRATHSFTSPLPSLLTGFPATSSVGATDDRATFGRRVAGVDLIVALLVILIVLALVGSIAVSPLLWVLVIILVLFAVRGRGRYYGRRG
jgi:fatty acid desaturase